MMTTASANHQPENEAPDEPLDLIGGPWAIIESDPGVFTTVMQRLGVERCEAAEIYSVEPDGLSHLENIHGFLFCSIYSSDSNPFSNYDTASRHVESAEEEVDNDVWFANQVIADACATQAILNVLFNCPSVNIGEALQRFKDFTKDMSPEMKGLAVSNDPLLRETHNSMARPADFRDALCTVVNNTTIDEGDKKKPGKGKSSSGRSRSKKATWSEEEAYHFIGYVPLAGKVWELDGLRSAPIEVGEIPQAERSPQNWLHVVRPAIRLKMESLQGEGGQNIRFNLLAIVEGGFEKRTDELELLRREKRFLERQLDDSDPGWKSRLADQALVTQAAEIFDEQGVRAPFAPDFGYQSMERHRKVLSMNPEQIPAEWARCIREAQSLKALLDEEAEKAMRWRTENTKRTHDYEPFFREFITALHEHGMLDAVLGKGEEVNGREIGNTGKVGRAKKT